MINFKKGKEHVCRGILEFLYSRFRKEEIGAAEAIPRGTASDFSTKIKVDLSKIDLYYEAILAISFQNGKKP